MASLAGFCCFSLRLELSESMLPVWDIPADEDAMDIAEDGRAYGAGEVERRPSAELLLPLLEAALFDPPHVSGEKRESDDGCWRTQNTKVLLMTKRAHWG